MAIRFRCAYCSQLMGIARRKAGTVVRCPKCSGEVVVPATEEVDAPRSPVVPSPIVFERSDFDEMFDSAAGGNKPVIKSSPGPAAAAAKQEPKPKVEEPPAALADKDLPAPAALPGILLSPKLATILSVSVVVALAIAFAAGLLVGWSLKGPSEGCAPSPPMHSDSVTT